MPQDDVDEAQRDMEAMGAPEAVRASLNKRLDRVVNVERENWATVIVFQECELQRHLVGLSTFARATVKFYLSGLAAEEVRNVCVAWQETLKEEGIVTAEHFRYNVRMLGDCRTMASAFAQVHNQLAG